MAELIFKSKYEGLWVVLLSPLFPIQQVRKDREMEFLILRKVQVSRCCKEAE